MELSVESGTELFSLMEDKGALGQAKTPNIAIENDGRTISVQVLEFKTSLLEAVEELHIHRDAETRHEEQICKLVVEKQELEWQKESLQSQISKMSNENSESLAAVKKQFQAQIRRLEGEKGKNQLAAELKDKEIISLKEELKLLQLLRYSLEKKLSELEQKLQLQTQTKDSHLNQLGEVERRFAAISRQCAMVKQAHEKLEQNVEEAMRINKKLTSINEKQESTIKALKEDLERLNKELVTFKVSSVCRPGEERLQNVLKEQELQQLQQRLLVETELNKKLRNETTTERAEKQEVLRSLHHNQRLLQTQTEALSRAEQEIRTFREEYQILKTEHELNQERTKEKDVSFARLRDEYQNSKLAWEKEILQLQMSAVADQEELMVVKQAYNQLQKEHKQLSISAVHKIALKDQENSLGTTSNEINLMKVSSLHKALEDSLISPHDNREPTSHPDKDIPDESTESQKARKDGHSQNGNKELDIFMQADKIVPVLSPVVSTDGSDNISRPEDVNPKTNHLPKLCDETKMGVSESEPVCNAVDKGCPSNPAQSDTDSRLAELSGPETRSVYAIDGDPLALEPKDRTLEQNLCISEVTESQTSDKHMDSQGYATSQSKEFKDHQTAIPEFLHSVSQKESQTSAGRLSEDKTANSNTQDTDITGGLIATQPSPCHKTLCEEPETPYESASATTSLDAHLDESKDQFSPPELICEPSQSRVSQADHSTETSLYNVVSEVESKQLPLVDQTTSVTAFDTVEVISENNDQKDDGTFLSQPLKAQQTELGVSFEEAKITNPDQDPSSPGSTTANVQSDVDQKSISMVDTSNHSENRSYQSSFAWDTFMKGKKKPHPTPSRTELWSSGFHELVSPFCAPLFMKDKLAKRAVMKTPDRLETPSNRPHQKNNCQGEWNAVKQSFSEMLMEKENQVLISYSSTLSGSPASSSVGNGLQQDCTPTVPPPKLQSLEKQTWPIASSSEGKEEWKQSDIMAQIAKIEEFMSSEGLTPQKRRKID
ncbi:coiled-coil domain-containing protein 73-like isoform X1 [Megalobrama amblycephala]|uniref:coiled-coil domain-containing protein 73-like isoform X1 n=1 Tax=Megalobrama amblycephala TaxID=75352 RepID=UPI002014341B|nr:coiled-coil domain-containing protein 73-like isoform X1 [Megalobrama amblycephala]